MVFTDGVGDLMKLSMCAWICMDDCTISCSLHVHFSRTALHLACLNDHEECAKLLLQAGADVSIADNVSFWVLLALFLTSPSWLAFCCAWEVLALSVNFISCFLNVLLVPFHNA